MKALRRSREVAELFVVLGTAAALASGCGGGTQAPAATTTGYGGAVGLGLAGPAAAHATLYGRGPVHVSAFALDSKGRLWLTASGADVHTGDGIYELAAAGDSAVKIAAVRGPLGLVWVGSSLYVSSLGKVTVFGGLHGDHFTTRRVVLSGPPGGGENNNLVRSPDGRLVMGVSAACDHCTPGTKWSGSIVSFTTAGKDLTLVARRIRAPYGLAYYPGTDDLFATLNQRDDLGTATPGDWLVAVKPGANWKFPGCYDLSKSACAGVPEPAAVLDAHAAAGGIAFVTSGRYAGSAIVAEWNLGKVLRVQLHRTAAGWAGAVSTFLTGIAHPLPVIVAHGGVLVGDWQTGRIVRIALG